MCAYNRFEGEPCCSNKQLLIRILREDWGYDDIVVSDCGAIGDFYIPIIMKLIRQLPLLRPMRLYPVRIWSVAVVILL